MSQSIIELTTLIPNPQYSILYHHQIGGTDYFSLRNKTTLAFYFTFEKLENISIHNVVYQTAEELINAFNAEFDAQQYIPENDGSGLDAMSQSIIELTTLIPNPQYSILYHHQIDNKDYFSLKSDNNRTSYFTFEKLENISINNIVYQTAEELINAFNAEFGTVSILEEKLDKDGYTGTAKTIDNRLIALEGADTNLPLYNNITSATGFSFTGQSLIINAFWEWVVLNVTYSNPLAVTKNIPYCAAGLKRIVYVVPNVSNGFDVISGEETSEILVAPQLPNNGIYVTYFIVTDSEIGEASIPILGENYITKVSKSFIRMFYTGEVDVVSIDDKSWLKFEQGMTSLKSINIPDPKNFYFGKSYIIKNGSTNNVTLNHQAGSGTFKFNFPNAQNLVLKPEESVHFIMRAINYTNTGGLLDYVGSQESQSLYPANLFKFVQKGFGNTNLQNNEIGDIFSGWKDDGTLRYPEAEWLGGPLNTSVNFKPLITIIIE